ncbi:hypothetical protein CYY_001309 [Polysphondylium violaceum]|uniref:Uncharacterized protein n=1 Tax=Polysphondylium violaceum TaxID=133409 RepID=A0A8J4Q9I9_9MYCE|nr:hypothetical protein CYY_001309 [Polysphondylium violaceum]
MNKLFLSLFIVLFTFNQLSSAQSSYNYAIGIWKDDNSLFNVGYVDLNGVNAAQSKLVLERYYLTYNTYQQGTINKNTQILTMAVQEWKTNDNYIISIDCGQWSIVSEIFIGDSDKYGGFAADPYSNNFYVTMNNGTSIFVQKVNPFTLFSVSFGILDGQFFGSVYNPVVDSLFVALQNSSGIYVNIYQNTDLIAVKKFTYSGFDPSVQILNQPLRLFFSPATSSVFGSVTVYDGQSSENVLVYLNFLSGTIQSTNMNSVDNDQIVSTIADPKAPFAYSFGYSNTDTFIYKYNTLLGTFVSKTNYSPLAVYLYE